MLGAGCASQQFTLCQRAKAESLGTAGRCGEGLPSSLVLWLFFPFQWMGSKASETDWQSMWWGDRKQECGNNYLAEWETEWMRWLLTSTEVLPQAGDHEFHQMCLYVCVCCSPTTFISVCIDKEKICVHFSCIFIMCECMCEHYMYATIFMWGQRTTLMSWFSPSTILGPGAQTYRSSDLAVGSLTLSHLLPWYLCLNRNYEYASKIKE